MNTEIYAYSIHVLMNTTYKHARRAPGHKPLYMCARRCVTEPQRGLTVTCKRNRGARGALAFAPRYFAPAFGNALRATRFAHAFGLRRRFAPYFIP